MVDPSTGDATAAVCQTPANQATWGTPNATIMGDSIMGLPTSAGIACYETAISLGASGAYSGETDTVEALDWTDTAHPFLSFANGNGSEAPVDQNCYLSPDGSQMACTSSSNGALTLVSSSGTATNTGRTYNGILGWIDAATCSSRSTRGTSESSTRPPGLLTTLAVPQANQVEMVATLPGAL